MSKNKHLEFLKIIKVKGEMQKKNNKNESEEYIEQIQEVFEEEEDDLQNELQRRFDELFGSVSED